MMASRSTPWLALILAGGLSSRMGKDKAQLIYQGENLLKRTIECARAADCQPIALSLAHNTAPPKEESCLYWPDRWPQLGPVGGLLSAIERCKEENLLIAGLIVVPVDLPLLSPEVLITLRNYCAPPHRAAYFHHHPLPCALQWDGALIAQTQNYPRTPTAVHHFLSPLTPFIGNPDVRTKQALRNINTPEDWRALP
jgi:molybdopterin-guanine dinucleotide biosynthesis protein A